LYGWDDILFFPSMTYLLCGGVVEMLGWWSVATRRLAFRVAFGHALALGVVLILGLYLVRRREAFADAFAVATGGTEEPVRLALQTTAASRPGSAFLRTHFDARRRLAWLEQAGRPFLDATRTDLCLLGLLWGTGATVSPLATL